MLKCVGAARDLKSGARTIRTIPRGPAGVGARRALRGVVVHGSVRTLAGGRARPRTGGEGGGRDGAGGASAVCEHAH
jgi:hypothetical protein